MDCGVRHNDDIYDTDVLNLTALGRLPRVIEKLQRVSARRLPLGYQMAELALEIQKRRFDASLRADTRWLKAIYIVAGLIFHDKARNINPEPL